MFQELLIGGEGRDLCLQPLNPPARSFPFGEGGYQGVWCDLINRAWDDAVKGEAENAQQWESAHTFLCGEEARHIRQLACDFSGLDEAALRDRYLRAMAGKFLAMVAACRERGGRKRRYMQTYERRPV